MKNDFTANIIPDISSVCLLEQNFYANKSIFSILICDKSNCIIRNMPEYSSSLIIGSTNFLVNYISDLLPSVHTEIGCN
jgi:hypothetical protein